MAKATKAQLAQVRSSLLRKLSQSEAAWLIDKPAVWLRDNSHVEGRNADGSYDAQKLVAAVRQEFRPAELSDADLEPVLQLVAEISMCLSHPRPATELLARIKERHGAAGLAAVGEALLVTLQEETAFESGYEEPPEPTAEGIRAEAERRIRDLDRWQARREGRVVLVCRSCRAYRWGRQWLGVESIPDGYAIDPTQCPACVAEEEKQAAKKKRR